MLCIIHCFKSGLLYLTVTQNILNYRGIYFSKYNGGGGGMAAGKKLKTEGMGKK